MTHLNVSPHLLHLVLLQDTQNSLESETRLELESVNNWNGTTVAKESANLVEHGSGWKLEHFSEETQSPSVGHPQHQVCDTAW